MNKRLRKYLFVCHANRDRSPTAEDVFKQMVRESNVPIEVSSAGMSQAAATPVTRKIADEADLIFVMEPHMKTELRQAYCQDQGKIVTLGIPDIYERGNVTLIRILRKALAPYLSL